MVRSRRVSVTVILFTAGVLLVCVWRVGSEQQRLSESGLLDWINLKASLIDDSSLFSDHEVPINDSELSSDLLRRASVNWNDAVSRAQRLLCLMEMAEEDLPATFQTAWTSFSSLTQYGWTSSQLYGAVDTALQSPFNQFGLSDTMPPLVQVQWSHSQDSTVGGIKYQATKARYKNIYNAGEGAIIAMESYSPAYIIANSKKPTAEQRFFPPRQPITGAVVPLSQWSDVTFLQLQQLSTAAELQKLTFVFRISVANQVTKEIILHAVGGPTKLQSWPGEDFGVEENAGLAMLGTPNGLGIGWLLAQHKADFGVKRVKGVRVWDEGATTDPRTFALIQPCMMFYVEDFAVG